MCHGTQEQNTTAKGTWEEIWAHRRSKGPLLRRTRGGGGDRHRNLFSYACIGSERVGHLWCRQVVRGHLLGLQKTWCLLCGLQVTQHLFVWAKGSGVGGKCNVAPLVIYRQGTNHSSHLRNQREAWEAITRLLGIGSKCGPSHHRGQQKRGY